MKLASLQVAPKLAVSGRMEIECGFDLDNHLSIDDHIESLTAQLPTFVGDWNADLSRDFVASGYQLLFQSQHV